MGPRLIGIGWLSVMPSNDVIARLKIRKLEIDSFFFFSTTGFFWALPIKFRPDSYYGVRSLDGHHAEGRLADPLLFSGLFLFLSFFALGYVPGPASDFGLSSLPPIPIINASYEKFLI